MFEANKRQTETIDNVKLIKMCYFFRDIACIARASVCSIKKEKKKIGNTERSRK